MFKLELNDKEYLKEDGVPSAEDNDTREAEASRDETEETSVENEESDEITHESDDSENEATESNYTTDEDDIAYVAERITGARHSMVTTAAPIRIRKNDETMRMNSLSRIVNESTEKSETNKEENEKKSKKFVLTTVISAVIIAVIFSAIIAGVNIAANKNTDADITIGDVVEDYVNLESTAEETETEKASETARIINETETVKTEETEETKETAEEETDTDSIEETEETETAEPKTEPVVNTPTYNVVLDFYDRDDIEISTEKMTLSNLLELCGITLGDNEVPSLSLDSVIAADTTITIYKYEYKSETVSEVVPYESIATETDLIPRGEKNYSQCGENGQKNKYYTVEYINGEENSRTLDYEETVRYPVDEIYEEGVGGSFVGSDGVTYTYSYRRVVPATYYNIEGLTYLGTMADESVIAVDMDNIPLGTRLYVKNDTYDFGVRIASDIGGQVDDWEIDIWLSSSNPQFASFSQVGYIYDMEIYYID